MSNYSLYAVPVSWFVAIFPHWYAVALTRMNKGELPAFRNSSPREFVARCQAAMLTAKKNPTIARYLRSEAASQNGMENIALFACAVIAGNLAGLPVDTLNGASLTYIGARVVYNLLYITNTSEPASALRTLSFGTGLGATFYLFVKAGKTLNAAAL